MKILSIDTSTATCTVGLVDGNDLVAESVDQSGQTHARHIMGMLDDTLTQAKMSLEEVDGFGVITGPGTFTGLRIGISTVQGMAYALSKPVAGITSLDALATQAATKLKHICPMVDARRHEVYYGFYVLHAKGLKQTGAHQVASPTTLLEQIQQPCYFLGTGARMYRQVISDSLGSEALFAEADLDRIHSGVIAKLARAQLQDVERQQLPLISPYYIRRSDAEVKLCST
jgi:tRNA threonylcarbamoyladenosine biosynthesis protein TsaB